MGRFVLLYYHCYGMIIIIIFIILLNEEGNLFEKISHGKICNINV